MNLELLSWIGAWIILSEILFVIGLKKNWDVFCIEEPLTDNWILWKFVSFLMIAGIMMLNLLIVFGVNDGFDFLNPNYINLFYEFLILGGLGCLFLINKLIVNVMKEENKKCHTTKTQ